MKERPILFSGDMVRAILEGRKTQTRRPVKPQPDMTWENGKPWWNVGGLGGTPACPYGRPVDLLWVRETWHGKRETHTIFTFYRADGAQGGLVWRPSIHMPRWACRLVLEVLTVRVERLQDITEEGAKAEGVEPDHIGACDCNGEPTEPYQPHIVAFVDLWNSIYGKRPGLSWDANPWVWVTEFKKMEPRA